MSIPTCVITGDVAGHPQACGDCDPCFAAHKVPEPVRRLIDEIIQLREKYSEACSQRDWNALSDSEKNFAIKMAF